MALGVLGRAGAGCSRPAICPRSGRAVTRLVTCAAASPAAGDRHVAAARFRRGTRQDENQLKAALWNEKMNPLRIEPSRFLIAEDEAGSILGFGQLEQKEPKVYELRSIVVVRPADRGKGLGQALVQALLGTLEPDDEVWLSTLRSSMSFYQRAGFQGQQLDVQSIGSIPRWMQLEACLGTVVAYLATQEPLCVMHRSRSK